MPTITDTAVCIRRWDFSETSQTVSLFTREHGILRGLAKGAKREKGSFSGGIDVLTRGQIVAIVKPGRELATLTQWSLEAMYRSLRQDLAANRAGLYMADLIHHMVREGDAHPELFDAFTAALASLDDHRRIDCALLMFQWSLLRHTGYQPEVQRDASRGGELPGSADALVFDPTAGGLVAGNSSAGASGWRVRHETIDLLRRLAREEPIAGQTDPKSSERANRLLASYMREIIGTEPAAMRWAFPDLPAPASTLPGGRPIKRAR